MVMVSPAGAAAEFCRYARARSPAPLEKVVDAGPRVQAPLTLSETWTWPVESYWPNQPASRSPAATGRVKVMVTLATLPPVLTEPPCIQCGLGGGGAGVVTGSAVEAVEWFPAVSTAST